MKSARFESIISRQRRGWFSELLVGAAVLVGLSLGVGAFASTANSVGRAAAARDAEAHRAALYSLVECNEPGGAEGVTTYFIHEHIAPRSAQAAPTHRAAAPDAVRIDCVVASADGRRGG